MLDHFDPRSQQKGDDNMSTMEAAMAAKANGEVLTGANLQDIIARAPSDADRGPGGVETNPTRQRQVGLG